MTSTIDHALPLLIETAAAARDQQAAGLRQADQAAGQARAQLQQLRDYRRDCLARSPAAALGRCDGPALQDYQRFVSRLDEAISQQEQQSRQREAVSDAARHRLVACQQKLLAFETLRERLDLARGVRASRVAQCDADEFAARATARRQAEARL